MQASALHSFIIRCLIPCGQPDVCTGLRQGSEGCLLQMQHLGSVSHFSRAQLCMPIKQYAE